jgi:HD-GYP domain-containing protein (c-di-GMP phosphodiesterase class II)
MEQSSNRVIRESIIAALLAVAGAYTFWLSLRGISARNLPTHEYFLMLFFAGCIVAADRFPIHLLRGTKLSLVNLPIFLATGLLAAPVAIVATGIGLLIANLLARAERGLLLRDIAASVGQWMATVYLGHQIVRLDQFGLQTPLPRFEILLLCAFFFLLIDFLVFSLSQATIYGEPFLVILKAVVKEGFSVEVIQYLIAIPGILAADEDLWSLILLIVPISITYSAFKNLKETRYETIQVLNDMADTVDLRDTCTGGHSGQVADLVHRLLIQLNIAGPEATLIEISARLHDIGKIGIPDRILLKPGKLTSEEMAVMQTHTQKGAELIAKYKDFSRGAAIVRHHHERWDGHGYPARLREHEIPYGARIIAVADSFEAMTSDRPYRKALAVDKAIQILLEGRGKQWDPNIVNAFVDMIINEMYEKNTEDLSTHQTDSTASQPVLTSSQRPLSL